MVAINNNPQQSGKYDALYGRYSSHAQDDSTSITVQIEACERMAGRALVHFIDQAKTGRTMGGRTELLRLIQEAEAGRVNKLYVYKFDRLGRAAETHVLVEDLERCGVEVVSVTEGTNALARGVQLVVAADYSRVLAERTRAGLVQRHKEGCWTGGPPPYGYQIVTAADGKKKLAIQPEEAEVVRFLFTTYLAESIGMKELARRLREKGTPTRQGGPWQFTTLRGILTNRMVVGEVRYLRRCFRLNRATGRRLPHFNEESGHLIQRDESLRIIDDETFGRVQERFAANGQRRPRGPRELRPFTRHLFCAECGNVCHARKSKNAKGEYHYYGCGKRQMQGPEACPNSVFVREDKLMERVTKAMSAMFEDMDAVLAEAMAMAKDVLDLNRTESDRLKTQIGEQDKLLVGLSRILIDPDIEPLAKKSIARQMAEAEGKREQLREALESVAVQSVTDSDNLLVDVRRAFLEAKQNFAGLLTPPQMNRFIEEVAGPMLILADGSVVQKDEASSTNKRARKESGDSLRAPSIAGGGFEPPTSGL